MYAHDGQRKTEKSVHSFHPVCPENQTHSIMLGNKYLYPLRNLAIPKNTTLS